MQKLSHTAPYIAYAVATAGMAVLLLLGSSPGAIVARSYRAYNGRAVPGYTEYTYRDVNLSFSVPLSPVTAVEARAKKDGYILFAYPRCPYCRNLLPVLAAVATSEGVTMDYCQVDLYRDILKVPDTLDVKLNDTDETAIEAKCEPKDASNISFDFASSDEEVATVDKDGKVKVLKAGECDITTTLLQDGEKVTEKTTHVKAFYEVESITLDSNEGKLTVGNSHTIKATVAPEEVAAKTTIEWSSSDEKVATVDSNGKVTAVSSGNATITATAGEESANYEVTVEQPKKVTTSNKTYTKNGSSNSSAVTPSNPAPVAPITPSAPATPSAPVTPVQPSNPEPAAPAPAQPDPAPAQPSNPEPAQPSNPEPAQPSQPSGGDSNTDWWGTVIPGEADKSCPPEDVGILC